MEIIDKMMNFKITESETYETIWDKFINFQTEYDKLELSKHPHFILGMILVKKAHEAGRITAEETRRLLDSIEKDNREPKN